MTGWEQKAVAGIEYFERVGEGDALVLLHGIGSNGAAFAALLPHLSPSQRVIAWNAPGYGNSEPLAETWPLASHYARKLETLFDVLALAQATLVGHSLGALMAAAFAVAHRARVARLVLASPALGHGIYWGGALSPAAQARIDDLERMGAAAFAAARAPRLVHDAAQNPALVAQVETGMAAVRLPGYAQAARMLASGRLLDDAERLAVPTDVIVGACDQITPPEGALRAHSALRGAAQGRLTILPDAGHAVYLQAPGAFAAALAANAETNA